MNTHKTLNFDPELKVDALRPLLTKNASFVAFGAGVNSTAMLIGLVHRQQPPGCILFADTGGERPETYQHRDQFSNWLREQGFPRITTVTLQSPDPTLEAECLRKKVLPSLAYGGRSCPLKWKERPQTLFLQEQWLPSIQTWMFTHNKVTRIVAFDAGETRRAKHFPDPRFHNCYPLIDWGWTRDDCKNVIAKAGLDSPSKSACFFCPATTKTEVLDLKRRHPCLFARALHLEDNARQNLLTIKGLGRRWSWRTIVETEDPHSDDFDEAPCAPCECLSG